jgi:ornithine carbamoyltransferase
MKDLVTLGDWPARRIVGAIDLALDVKRRPAAYREAFAGRTLIMLFEKPSLRTRVSFETAASQMGGHAIHYDLGRSPLGAGKESVEDTARTLSRYVDAIMARLYSHESLERLARFATVPVINGLTDFAHPTQVLADLLTIRERKGRLAGLRLAYLGDSNNNVTHSLLVGCAKVGMHIAVGCPAWDEYRPDPRMLRQAAAFARRSGARIRVTSDPAAAVRGADVVYTDSWMSYHIDPARAEERLRVLRPYQVNAALMRKARRGAIFMNCLPAWRGHEQTAEVIDGPQSVVFDEAENRLHMHKAILLTLLGSGRAPAA